MFCAEAEGNEWFSVAYRIKSKFLGLAFEASDTGSTLPLQPPTHPHTVAVGGVFPKTHRTTLILRALAHAVPSSQNASPYTPWMTGPFSPSSPLECQRRGLFGVPSQEPYWSLFFASSALPASWEKFVSPRTGRPEGAATCISFISMCPAQEKAQEKVFFLNNKIIMIIKFLDQVPFRPS